MDVTPLTRILLASALNLALASLFFAATGLLIARIARRSAPLRHGMALSTLCLLLLLPVAPFAAAFVNANWVPRVPLIPWPAATASTHVTTASSPRSTGADLGATGSASASTLGTLSAEEIPAGAILPGQSSQPQPTNTERRGLTPPLETRFNFVAVGLAMVATWLFGTMVSCLLTVRGALRVTRLVRASSPVSDLALLSFFDQLAHQLRLRRSPSLRNSSAVGVPFAWGLFRAVIVLPRPLADAGDAAQLRPVLLHELAHVRRRDVWTGLLQRIAAAMYWWNPFVHRLNSRLAEVREQICDAHVLAGGCPPREYAELLVELAARVTLPHPAAAPGLLTRSEPQLTRRVQHLLEDPPMCTSLRWFGKLALMAVIILGTTTAILVAAVMVNERRISTFTVIPDRQVNLAYVGSTPIVGSRPQRFAVPAAQPAAETFADSNPFLIASPPSASDGADRRTAPSFGDEVVPSPTVNPATGGTPGGAAFVPSPTPGVPGFAGPAPIAVDMDEALFGRVQDAKTRFSPMFIGEGSIHGLAVIELVGNEDGTLKDIRWFTESLGNDAEAATKLTERLTSFAAAQPTTVYRMEPRQDGRGQTIYVAVPVQMNRTVPLMAGATRTIDWPFPHTINSPATSGPQTSQLLQRVLAAQITASPQLRYEHVARAVALCEPHVRRVIIGQSDVTPELTLTLGFVRDGAGKKISSSPVLIWNDAVVNVPHFSPGDGDAPVQKQSEPHDKIVEVHSLPLLLLSWRQTLSGDAQPRSLTARIRADDGVDPKLVEQVVQAILPAGFERVVLEPLGPPAGSVQAVVIEIKDTVAGKNFIVSIGSDDGVVVGSVFKYQPSPTFIPEDDVPPGTVFADVATLEAHTVASDYAVCVLKSGSPAPKVGTNVSLEPAPLMRPPAVEPANSEPLPTY